MRYKKYDVQIGGGSDNKKEEALDKNVNILTQFGLVDEGRRRWGKRKMLYGEKIIVQKKERM